MRFEDSFREAMPADKVPANLEAERSVLGAILLDPAALLGVVPILDEGDFYDARNCEVYREILNLSQRQAAIDLLTVKEGLSRNGGIEKAGGSAYLAALIDGVPDIGNVEQYARIVKEKAALRRMIRAGQRIAQSALVQEKDVETLLADAGAEIRAIEQAGARERLDGWLSPAAVLRVCPRPKARFASTLAAINKATCGGLPTGALVAYVGIPDAGKTGIVIQEGVEIALRHDVVLVIFTPDQGREATALRIGALLGLDQGKLEERDETEIARLDETLRERRILLPDDCDEQSTTENVIAVAERIRPDLPHVLVLDSLQEARARGGPDDDGEKDNVIANIRACRKAATSSAVAWLVLATSQTTKASQSRDPKSRPPAIMAGADSAKIGFATQLIVYLEGDPSVGPAFGRAIVAKNKLRGPKPTFGLRLDPATTRLEEIDSAAADQQRDERAAQDREKVVSKLADRILALLMAKGPLNVTAIRERMSAKKKDLLDALDGLEARKAATWTPGKRNSRVWEAVARG